MPVIDDIGAVTGDGDATIGGDRDPVGNIEAQLDEHAAGPGRTIGIDGDLDDGRRLTGKVRRVYPEVDRATRLGKVRIRLGEDPALRIGAFARGNVEVARRTGVAVPVSSLLYAADGRASVLVAKDGRVEARPVTTGLSSEGYTEIRSGVAAGASRPNQMPMS